MKKTQISAPIISMIIATTNKDKFKDLGLILGDIGIHLELPDKKIKIKEDADDLMANAKKKALQYSRKYSNRLILATDGGAKIPFLGDNWNHVLTKRLNGVDIDEKFSDKKRCKNLLKMMESAKGEERKVFWNEAFAIALNNKVLYTFEASSPPGYLLDKIPDNFSETGYWIGYLWYKPEYKKTYMALTEAEKKTATTVGKLLNEDLAKKISNLTDLI